jgi:hypothetical protein
MRQPLAGLARLKDLPELVEQERLRKGSAVGRSLVTPELWSRTRLDRRADSAALFYPVV